MDNVFLTLYIKYVKKYNYTGLILLFRMKFTKAIQFIQTKQNLSKSTYIAELFQ